MRHMTSSRAPSDTAVCLLAPRRWVVSGTRRGPRDGAGAPLARPEYFWRKSLAFVYCHHTVAGLFFEEAPGTCCSGSHPEIHPLFGTNAGPPALVFFFSSETPGTRKGWVFSPVNTATMVSGWTTIPLVLRNLGGGWGQRPSSPKELEPLVSNLAFRESPSPLGAPSGGSEGGTYWWVPNQPGSRFQPIKKNISETQENIYIYTEAF